MKFFARGICTALLASPRCAPPIAQQYAEPDLASFAISGPPQIIEDPGRPYAEDSSSKPNLLYLPGIELSGYSLHRQVEDLRADFDVRWLGVAADDRSTFEQLADVVTDAITSSGYRKTYVVGESFGGVLALYVAMRSGKPPEGLAGLVLINPATSVERSWAVQLEPLINTINNLPEPAGMAAYMALGTPIFAGISAPGGNDPLAFGRRKSDSSLPGPLADLTALSRLSGALPQLTALPAAFPLKSVAYRLQMLREAAKLVADLPLARLTLPVDLLVSSDDKLLPSKEEGRRLQRALPNGRLETLEGSGHVPLLEARVSLAELLRASKITSRVPSTRKDYVGAFTPPTAEQFANASASLLPVRKATSPIFLSTMADGRRVAGLGGLPPSLSSGERSSGERTPVLFIGNHQLYGFLDLPLLVEEVYAQTGTLVRGLAHPVAFRTPTATTTAPQESSENADGGSPRRGGGGGGGGGFVDFEEFGAVPVSPRALFQLLSRGEPALLYPGGVREAFKSTKKGEAYKLFWPDADESADFARVAARFDATIVPVAAIGAEEGFEMLLDADEMLDLPILGERIKEAAKSTPVGRKGERFVSPLSVPKPLPGRFYFLFGAPISTAGVDPKDKAACKALYTAVQDELTSSLAYLLEQRERDPYEPLLPRAAIEASWDWKQQAPSFPVGV